ncbi:hypothetical protein HDU97_007613 [Phlyctochytrium planicorne]|nr:hypothetical protein HDU97_007613 [Phlyctochytrium planicorne]
MAQLLNTPKETLQRILEWTEEYSVAIKNGIPLARHPSQFSIILLCLQTLPLSDFPIASRPTSQFDLLPKDIDASTVSLAVIASLLQFRPEVFSRRSGWLVKELVQKNRLEALKLIERDPKVKLHAFGWIDNVEHFADGGQPDVFQFLHETVGIQIPFMCLTSATRAGNIALVKYLKELGSESYRSWLMKEYSKASNQQSPVNVLTFNCMPLSSAVIDSATSFKGNDALVKLMDGMEAKIHQSWLLNACLSNNAKMIRHILENYDGDDFETPNPLIAFRSCWQNGKTTMSTIGSGTAITATVRARIWISSSSFIKSAR